MVKNGGHWEGKVRGIYGAHFVGELPENWPIGARVVVKLLPEDRAIPDRHPGDIVERNRSLIAHHAEAMRGNESWKKFASFPVRASLVDILSLSDELADEITELRAENERLRLEAEYGHDGRGCDLMMAVFGEPDPEDLPGRDLYENMRLAEDKATELRAERDKLEAEAHIATTVKEHIDSLASQLSESRAQVASLVEALRGAHHMANWALNDPMPDAPTEAAGLDEVIKILDAALSAHTGQVGTP